MGKYITLRTEQLSAVRIVGAKRQRAIQQTHSKSDGERERRNNKLNIVSECCLVAVVPLFMYGTSSR